LSQDLRYKFFLGGVRVLKPEPYIYYALSLSTELNSRRLKYKVLVERKNYAFFVDFNYKKLPDFCIHCNKIGHYIDVCKFADKPDPNTNAERKKKSTKEVRKVYIQTKDGRTKQVSNDVDPIVIKDNNDMNKKTALVNKEKSPITAQQFDKVLWFKLEYNELHLA